MATFVLKKYNDLVKQEEKPQEDVGKEYQELSQTSGNKKEEVMINVSGSISSVVASALHKLLATKDIEMQIIEAENKEQQSKAKIISQEDINADPISTFKSIDKGDVVFINNKGFNTDKEEWFLTNLSNKTDNVFYTVESFGKFLIKAFEDATSWVDENGEGSLDAEKIIDIWIDGWLPKNLNMVGKIDEDKTSSR